MIAISADSTCDLSKDLLEQYNIAIAPLYILKEEQAFRDGVDFHPQDIFDYVEKNGKLLKTSAVSVQDYIELFSRLRENAEAVVHINLSSEFSACYQNACLAAREVSEVYVVDSRNLSTGSGLVVLAAADLAAQGVPAAQIQEEMDRLTARVEASFVVERLDYLYKGGRCSALAALGANLLHLKPCIEVRSGKMGVGKKYRGSFDKALREYVTDRLRGGKISIFIVSLSRIVPVSPKPLRWFAKLSWNIARKRKFWKRVRGARFRIIAVPIRSGCFSCARVKLAGPSIRQGAFNGLRERLCYSRSFFFSSFRRIPKKKNRRAAEHGDSKRRRS